jgi:hypothetical protein
MSRGSVEVLLAGPSKEARALVDRIATETSAAAYAVSTLGEAKGRYYDHEGIVFVDTTHGWSATWVSPGALL